MFGEFQRRKPFWVSLLLALLMVPLIVMGFGLFFLIVGLALLFMLPAIFYSLWKFTRQQKEFPRSRMSSDGEVIEVYFEERSSRPSKHLER